MSPQLPVVTLLLGLGLLPGAGPVAHETLLIRDLDYVKGVYFFLGDPNQGPFDVPDSSIRIYFDYGFSSHDLNTIDGRALIDPHGPDSTAADSAKGAFSVRGTFMLLEPGADQDYDILSDLYGPGYKVIRLRHPMDSFQFLAASYSRRPMDPDDHGVGPYVAVGGGDSLDSDGRLRRVLKLLWAPPSLMVSGISDFFDPALTLTQSRNLELKNFYSIFGLSVDPSRFMLRIRKGRSLPPETSLPGPDGIVPYIEALGLDNFDETKGTPSRGHDGEVDRTPVTSATKPFLDFENALVFFYDLRPFAPRIGTGGRPFENLISSALNRRVTLADVSGAPNPDIYEKRTLQPDFDTVYWIEASHQAVDSLTPALALAPARPNPFDRSTALDYELPRAARMRARVFDVTGRTIITLFDGASSAGRGQLIWSGGDEDGRETRAGIYIVAVEVDGALLTRRIVKLR